jgi:hypothetical protein
MSDLRGVVGAAEKVCGVLGLKNSDLETARAGSYEVAATEAEAVRPLMDADPAAEAHGGLGRPGRWV